MNYYISNGGKTYTDIDSICRKLGSAVDEVAQANTAELRPYYNSLRNLFSRFVQIESNMRSFQALAGQSSSHQGQGF